MHRPIVEFIDEEAFHRAIAADVSNSTNRLVFSDWLEEQGDWRAEGYREMGEKGLYPSEFATTVRTPEEYRRQAWWQAGWPPENSFISYGWHCLSKTWREYHLNEDVVALIAHSRLLPSQIRLMRHLHRGVPYDRQERTERYFTDTQFLETGITYHHPQAEHLHPEGLVAPTVPFRNVSDFTALYRTITDAEYAFCKMFNHKRRGTVVLRMFGEYDGQITREELPTAGVYISSPGQSRRAATEEHEVISLSSTLFGTSRVTNGPIVGYKLGAGGKQKLGIPANTEIYYYRPTKKWYRRLSGQQMGRSRARGATLQRGNRLIIPVQEITDQAQIKTLNDAI